jgi:hypothetical protein
MARGTHDNDNEPLSFIHIAAATANVVSYLRIDEQKNGSGHESDAGQERNQVALKQGELVRRRLRKTERK